MPLTRALQELILVQREACLTLKYSRTCITKNNNVRVSSPFQIFYLISTPF